MEERHVRTVVRHVSKNSLAKRADPTGWPRRRNPCVSSVGRGGWDLSVGCGVVENVEIVEVMSS
jgi:hypothetical protein